MSVTTQDPQTLISIHEEYPELETIFTPLAGHEYQQLRDSIKKRGIMNPILIWDNRVIDGHHRWTASKELGLPEIPCIEVNIEDQKSLREFYIESNVLRRQLTIQEKVKAAKLLWESENAGRDPESMELNVNGDHAPLSEVVASKLGVKPRQCRELLAAAKAPEHLIDFIGHGITVKQAAQIGRYLSHPARSDQERSELVSKADEWRLASVDKETKRAKTLKQELFAIIAPESANKPAPQEPQEGEVIFEAEEIPASAGQPPLTYASKNTGMKICIEPESGRIGVYDTENSDGKVFMAVSLRILEPELDNEELRELLDAVMDEVSMLLKRHSKAKPLLKEVHKAINKV